ncbi:hypothetical protein Tco_1116852 [Tanacetum coccineum]
MIAYLQKSEGSEGFHQIIDFLTASHIKYALTKNLTIYVSLIDQFWQTATASTLEDGDMGTDNQEKDEKQRQNDKTGLGMEKTGKTKPNQSRKVNPVKKSTEKSTGQSQSHPKSTPGPKSKKYKFRG